MVQRITFALFFLFISLNPVWADTIKEIITSDPPGADIYWGKTASKLLKTGFKTPHTRSIQAKAWESWCYQVKMEGYQDSEVVSRLEESGDRNVHFILFPIPSIKEIITSDPPGADIYWGKNEIELKNSGLKTPYTRETKGISWSPYCYQIKKDGYIDSKIECRPEEFEERRLNFILSPTAQKIKEEENRRIASYIDKQKKSSKLEPKDSFTEKAYDYFNKAKTQSSRPSDFLVSGTSTKSAISSLENATKENPYYHAALYVLGLSYFRSEDYEEAEKNLTKSIELKPLYHPAYEKLGDLYLSQKQYDKSINYYNKALELGNPTLNIYYHLGILYLQIGNLESSEKAYLNALNIIGDKKPENISNLSYFLSIHSALVEIYLRYGNLKKSWEHLKISSASDIKLIPLYEDFASRDEFYANVSLGHIYYISNRYKNAVKYYEKAIDINENNFFQYYELGAACKALKQYKKAIKYLSKALELDADHYYSNLQLGVILGSLDSNTFKSDFKLDYAKSIQYLNKAIGINSGDAIPLFYLGRAYLNIGKLHDALDYTEKALTIEDDYSTFRQLGDIYYELKDYLNAAEQYRNALILNDNSSIRLSLANSLLYLREYDKTITFLKESSKIYPQSALFLNKLGDVYLRKGNIQDAISSFKQTLAIDIKNFHALFEMAVAYSELNNRNEAEKYFLNAVSINPESYSAHFNCGITYIRKKQYNSAIRHLSKALSLKPGDNKTKNLIKEYRNQIDVTALKNIKNLSRRDDEVGMYAKLLFHSVDYNKGNDTWIEGTIETEFKDGENIVSPKIYEALDFFSKIKEDIDNYSKYKGKIREAIGFFSTSVDLRINGIKQHAGGYYKKESEYEGEYEKGRAKIRLADENYVDFLILIQEIGMEHRPVFDDLIKLYLEYNLEYYSRSQGS